MTVKELKDFLSKYPDDMEIIERRFSDLDAMNIDNWSKIRAIDVRTRRGYIMYYPENDWRLKDPIYRKEVESVGIVKEFIHFNGN